MARGGRILSIVIVVATTLLLVGLPLYRSGGDLGGTSSYLLQTATVIVIYAIICIGLNVQLGYAGITNFGVAGFFLLGAYVAAIFVVPPASNEFVAYVGGFGPALDIFPALRTDQWLPFLLGILAAMGACALLATLLSLLTPRLREDYLAIATIGVAELLRSVAIVEDHLVNGDRGLVGIRGPFEAFFSLEGYPIALLTLLVAVLVLVYWAAERAVRSPWGRVLRALREDEIATAAVGKNAFAFKMQSFILGAALTGVGGALYAFYRRGLTPQDFEPLQGTFIFWVMLIVGGIGSNRGAILGAYVVWGLWLATLQLAAFSLPDEISSRIPYLRYVLLGVFFIAMLLIRPQGLVPEERRVSVWVDKLTRMRPLAPAKPAGTVPGASD